MKDRIELSKDILTGLTKDERILLIDIVPKEHLVGLIKRSPKAFKDDIAGCRLDAKSALLIRKLPGIYLKGLKKKDPLIMKLMYSQADDIVNKVNKHLMLKTGEEDFLTQTTQSAEIERFANLIENLLGALEPQNINLFFRLIEHDLTLEQKEYIEKDMVLILEKKALRTEIRKELELEFEQQKLQLDKKHKEEEARLLSRAKKNQTELELKNKIVIEEKDELESLVDNMEQNEAGLNLLISQLEDTIQKEDKKLQDIASQKKKLELLVKEQELLMADNNKKLDLKYKEYSEDASGQWELENKSLLQSQEDLQENCKELEQDKKELEQNIALLGSQKQDLEDRILEYEEVISTFIENIDKKIIERELNTVLLEQSATREISNNDSSYSSVKPYVKENRRAVKIEKCSSIQEFSENIAINLENIGVRKIADEVADYIVGILASGLTPLICGGQAREIARAISAAYNGETPYIIALPNGYINSQEIASMFKQVDASSVLIEDCVGTMNENALLPLLREQPQVDSDPKILMLAVEDVSLIKYMSNNMLNHVALIFIEEFYIPHEEEYQYCDAQHILKRSKQNSNIKEEFKKMKNLLRGTKLGSNYELSRANILFHSHACSNIEKAIIGYTRSELKLLCEYKDLYDVIDQNLETSDTLDQALKDIIRGDEN